MTEIAMSPARFRVRELVEESGLGQSELARRAGISFATVNRLCQNATGQVSLETLDKLAIALGESLGRSIEPGELIEREGKRRGKAK
jgi:transcriptional regulator with XRE-family HTH domain